MAIQNLIVGGPLASGTVKEGKYNDGGVAVLCQCHVLTQNGAAGPATYDDIFYVPIGSEIIDFVIDLTVAWDSATSAALTAGKTSTGTDYVSSVDLKGALARKAITYTATQLTNMSNAAAATGLPSSPIYLSIVETGAGTAALGTVIVAIRYSQR